MNITLVSDTHRLHEDLPPLHGDLLIHCGDFEDTAALDLWFAELEFEKIVVVGGNHDYDAFEKWQEGQQVFFHADFLVDQSIDFRGLKIYGSPWVSELEGAAFSLTHDEMIETWNAIPDQTDILVTHVPPYGILDLARSGDHWGCQALRNRVEDLCLRFHSFGHVHASYGRDDVAGITFYNASAISGGEIVNQPIVIQI